jgi:8-oxo-dGTP diphosphatase
VPPLLPEPPRIVVTAAVIERHGEFLLTRRLQGAHLEGCWEFPGGKCDAGESLEACLAREIREELDVDVLVRLELLACAHEYPDRVVELHFFDCEMVGEPSARLNQEMRWVPQGELRSLQFPPADDALIELLTRISRI